MPGSERSGSRGGCAVPVGADLHARRHALRRVVLPHAGPPAGARPAVRVRDAPAAARGLALPRPLVCRDDPLPRLRHGDDLHVPVGGRRGGDGCQRRGRDVRLPGRPRGRSRLRVARGSAAMDVIRRVQRWAWSRPRVLLVDAPGAHDLRWTVEAELDRRGWTCASSPAETDLLVVLGTAGEELSRAVDVLWSQVPQPRHRSSVGSGTDVGRVLDTALDGLLATATGAPLDEQTRPSPATLLGRSEDDDHAGHGSMDHTGHTDVDHTDRKSTRLNSSHANISYAVF